MKSRRTPREFLLCVGNDGFETSLVVRRVYERIDDPDARALALVRVLDETGDDYLFPARLFVPIEVPSEACPAFSTTH